MPRLVRVLIGLILVSLMSGHANAATPNLIIINIDDLGYADIGPYGSPNRTPHLDRMAKEGRKLTSHYAAPVCSPSRASLMTGSYAKRALPVQHVLFPASAVGLHPDEVTIADVLKTAGYATACFGKWHLGDQSPFLPTRQGFDHYFGIPYSNDMGPAADGAKSNPDKPLPTPGAGKGGPPVIDEVGIRGAQPPQPLLEGDKVVGRVRAEDQFEITRRYTERAVAFIRERRDRPFFLYLPHNAVHFPLYPGKEFRGKSGRGLLADWIEEIDWSVGQVLSTLRELGLAENTLVIFTSDNGGPVNQGANNGPLRGSKGQIYEGGIRTCTLAWWPGRVPAGTSTGAMTSMMDFLPTFARLAGAKLPAGRKLDGVDIWPALSGDSSGQSPRTEFFYFRGLTLQAVRSGAWKLILPGAEGIAGKKKVAGALQLFNLEQDLGESHDMASANPEVVQRLQKLVQSMAADLGLEEVGPGCRPLGRVTDPQPLIAADGKVRADALGKVERFP